MKFNWASVGCAFGMVLGGLISGAAPTWSQAQQPDLSALVAEPQPIQDPTQDSFLTRKDVPPEGIARLYGWSLGGSGGPGTYCTLDAVHPLNMSTLTNSGEPVSTACTLSPLSALSLQFPSDKTAVFDPAMPVAVRITRPDGSEAFRAYDADKEDNWIVPLAAPFGTYTVEARQGAWHASGSLIVKAEGDRLVRVVPSFGPPGTTFRVLLAGYAPFEVVGMFLMKGGNGSIFGSSLPAAIMNASGQAIYTVRTAATDPLGEFRIATQPESTGPFGHNQWETFRVASSSVPSDSEQRNWATWNAEAVVEQANAVWASAVGPDGRTEDDLGCVFEAQALDVLQSDIQAMRARGQYRVARQLSPVVVRDINGVAPGGTYYRDAYEATVEERWTDTLYNTDGSVAQVMPENVTRRYVIKSMESPGPMTTRTARNASQECRSGRLIVAASPGVGQSGPPSRPPLQPHEFAEGSWSGGDLRAPTCGPRSGTTAESTSVRAFVVPSTGTDYSVELYVWLDLEPDFAPSLTAPPTAGPEYVGRGVVRYQGPLSSDFSAPTTIPAAVPLQARDGSTTTAHLGIPIDGSTLGWSFEFPKVRPDQDEVTCDPPIHPY